VRPDKEIVEVHDSALTPSVMSGCSLKNSKLRHQSKM
jgi:hypothetical protein